jgi:hypothetical protein
MRRQSLFILLSPVLALACSGSTADVGGGGGGSDSGASQDGGAVGAAPDASTHDAQAGTDSGVAPDGAVTGPTAQDACTAAADAVCGKLTSCSPFVTGVTYGDTATCKARFMLGCLPSFTAPSTSNTPAKTAACAQAVTSLACAAFLDGQLGAACATVPGGIAQGAACADDAQCVTSFCARGPNAACGTCSPPTKAGDPCVAGACSAGTVCPSGQSTCVAPVAGRVDDACTVQEECDLAHAVGCNTSSRKCIALTLASGTCGANGIAATSYAVCPATGTCSNVFNGTCSPAAADGASCSTTATGAHCVPPARCIGGTCAIANASACH